MRELPGSADPIYGHSRIEPRLESGQAASESCRLFSTPAITSLSCFGQHRFPQVCPAQLSTHTPCNLAHRPPCQLNTMTCAGLATQPDAPSPKPDAAAS
jgi:hypothetical protein